MRLVIFFAFLVWLSACSECSDCGITHSFHYYAVNNSADAVLMKFYRGNATDSLEIDSHSKEELFALDAISNGGKLSTKPFNEQSSEFDSVKYVIGSNFARMYLKDSCYVPDNPLCQDAYIKSEYETSSGNTVVEYTIDIY